MACMGADYSHAEPLSNAIADAIIEYLREQGIERPVGDDMLSRLGKLHEKWDVQEKALRNALKEMIELDATAKF